MHLTFPQRCAVPGTKFLNPPSGRVDSEPEVNNLWRENFQRFCAKGKVGRLSVYTGQSNEEKPRYHASENAYCG